MYKASQVKEIDDHFLTHFNKGRQKQLAKKVLIFLRNCCRHKHSSPYSNQVFLLFKLLFPICNNLCI